MADPEEVTNPNYRIPSAEGVVATGKEPEPEIVTAIRELWGQQPVRDAVASVGFRLLGAVFPKSPWAIALQQLQPHITAIIETGSK